MIWENVALALSSLRTNKMRALLTMLGIIIGIMSIVAIIIIGDAMTASVTDNLATLGTNNITVAVQERDEREEIEQRGMSVMVRSVGSGKAPTSDDLLSDALVADMREEFGKDIIGVSIEYNNGSAQAKDGDLYANVSIAGVNQDYTKANTLTLLKGRFISAADVREKGTAAVVSDKFVKNMFPDGRDPLGQTVKVYKPAVIEIYTIVGVYEYEQFSFGGTASDQDVRTSFYIPVTTAKQDLLEKNYQYFTVVGAVNTDVNALTDRIQRFLDRQYAGNRDWKASASNMTTMLDTISTMLGTMSTAIAFIAGISLLVGGIGVMNIMLVSVTERTREIGTRKALGAKNFHIRFQFVTEAMIIALVGGVIGLLLGVVVGFGISKFFEVPLVLSPTVMIGSMVFSMAIGIFFGLYPANKAAKLDPIDALRYE